MVILDRPRHEKLIAQVRETGARIHLITDGDVAGAIMAARDGTGIDLLLGGHGWCPSAGRQLILCRYPEPSLSTPQAGLP